MSRAFELPLVYLALLYVAAVLAADTLAAQRIDWAGWGAFEWHDLRWHPADLHRWLWSVARGWGVSSGSLSWLQYGQWQSFDLFKFAFWLALPLVFCVPRMEWAWLGVRRMRGRDWLGLLLIAAAGVGAMALIPLISELRQTYSRMSFLTGATRWEHLQSQLVWLLSWLLGWEFLHRYVLLRSAWALSLRHGWWLVPLAEGLYHLQKPLLEATGMVALSVVLTQWTMRRRTLLPALLAHLLIELELLAYQLL